MNEQSAYSEGVQQLASYFGGGVTVDEIQGAIKASVEWTTTGREPTQRQRNTEARYQHLREVAEDPEIGRALGYPDRAVDELRSLVNEFRRLEAEVSRRRRPDQGTTAARHRDRAISIPATLTSRASRRPRPSHSAASSDGDDDPPAAARVCLSLDCDRPREKKARGPVSEYCADPACRKRDERRRKNLEALASETWESWRPEPEQELQQRKELELIGENSSPSDPQQFPNIWASSRRREGLHKPAFAFDGSTQVVIGGGKEATRRCDLRREMETDGSGEVLGCEKKKAEPDSYEDLRIAAKLAREAREKGKLPPPGRRYTRWRYSDDGPYRPRGGTVVALLQPSPRIGFGFAEAPVGLRKVTA